jgi:hypothetical protein
MPLAPQSRPARGGAHHAAYSRPLRVIGSSKHSSEMRCTVAAPAKRSSNEAGRRVSSTDGMNALRPTRQNGIPANAPRHHSCQRAMVCRLTPNCAASCRVAAAPHRIAEISTADLNLHAPGYAYATTTALVLAQPIVPEKTNEITAIPELLDNLAERRELTGALVSIDAMDCQVETVDADYLLALKGSQPTLEAVIAEYFRTTVATFRRKIEGETRVGCRADTG